MKKKIILIVMVIVMALSQAALCFCQSTVRCGHEGYALSQGFK